MAGSEEDADEISFFLDVGSRFPVPPQARRQPRKPPAKSAQPEPTDTADRNPPDIAPPVNTKEPSVESSLASSDACADRTENDFDPAPDQGDDDTASEALPLYLGHRQRVRARFDKIGGEAFEDYELLEIALFGAVPRGDTKVIAKRLLSRFGTFAEVVGAPKHLLMEVEGIGKNAATDIKVMAAVAQRLTRGAVIKREALTSWSAILDYLRVSMAFNEIETFRVLYLNKKNLLVSDEVQQEGIVDHTPAYPSKVINRAYNLGATAIVLVHNHPSGDPEPSRADIELTKAIINAGKGHNIVVHDHIIVGRDGHSSLRSLGYIG